jgi:hypothetical protein
MVRVPKSQIQENLTAKDGEFVYPSSGLPYTGKYHIIQGQAYAGTTQSTYLTPIKLEIPSTNIMAYTIGIGRYATAAYAISQKNINMAKGLYDEYKPQQIIQSSPRKEGIKNYLQKSNDLIKIIKEVSSNDVYQLKQDPINKIVTIDFSLDTFQEQLKSAEKIIPGITEFVNLVSV